MQISSALLWLCWSVCLLSHGQTSGLATDTLSRWIAGSGLNLVDLSYDFAEDTIVWPTSRKFQVTNRVEGPNAHGIWLSSQEFCSPEHGGTHMDAPVHFATGRWTVDQIPIDRFVATAVVVDITTKVAHDNDAQMTTEDLLAWEAKHGPIANNSVVLMYSGWGKHWFNESAFYGTDDGDVTNLHFPGVHPEAAKWLVANRSIVGVGVDTASLDYGASKDMLTHRVLSEANIYGLENVASLDRLPPSGVVLYILPMKIRGGTGGPCRILAQLNPTVQSNSATTLSNSAQFCATLLIIIINVLSLKIVYL